MRRILRFLTAACVLPLVLGIASCSDTYDETTDESFTLNASVESMLNTSRDEGYAASVTVSSSAFDNATVFNKNLAMASYLSTMETASAESIKKLYESIGFDNIVTGGYEESDDIHLDAYCLAHKNINGSDVIACVTRCLGYGIRFSGNLVVGTSGDHEGFSIAANSLYEKLKSYIESKYENSYKAKTLKLWLPGYSRTAAIANVLSYMILGEKKLDIENKNVFTYAVATPYCLTKEHSIDFPNVFNLVSEADVVALVPPAVWGLGRCGKDKIIYRSNSDSYTEHKQTDKLQFSDFASVTETYSYTSVLDGYLKELDPELEYPAFGIHKSSWLEYADGTSSTPSENTPYYTTERGMVDWLLNMVMEKDGSATGGYSLKTRELYASTVQEYVSYAIKLFFENTDAFASLAEDLKENPLVLISKWMMNADGLYDSIKEYLGKKSATYDDAKLKSTCTALLQMIDMAGQNGCLTDATLKILTLALNKDNSDLKRVFLHHLPEIQYVLIKNYAE